MEENVQIVGLNNKEFELFYSVIDDERDLLMFRLLYETGIRVSELLFLKFKDIEGNTLLLRGYISNGKEMGYIQEPVIILDEELVALLHEYKKDYELMESYDENDFLFSNDNKECVSVHLLKILIRKYTNIANKKYSVVLPRIKLYDFRYNCVNNKQHKPQKL